MGIAPCEQVEELADLFQVVLTLIETMGFSLLEVAAMAERKGAGTARSSNGCG